MPRLTIDNREVTMPEGATILDAAAELGIRIPTLCFLKGQLPLTSCFVCVVKVNGKDNLVPACATVAVDGMKVESQTAEVLAARRACLELLMSDHLGDCMAPCHSICPARMSIPRMIRHIAAGNTAEALATAASSLVLPATLGRICPAPCEKGCRRAARDAAVSIRALHRFATDTELAARRPFVPQCKPATGKSVAIVGAGPAGLSAAYHLLQAGHACTIFDDHDAPGGMLRYGVDEKLLLREVLDAEIEPLRRMGAVFRMGVGVGRDITMDELRRTFAAVVLAVGEIRPVTGDAFGVKALAGGGVHADRHTMQTSVAGIFAAGDVTRPAHDGLTPSPAPAAIGQPAVAGVSAAGDHPKHHRQRMAVRSVADGAAAAAAVDQYLRGQPLAGQHHPFTCHIGPLKEGEIDKFCAKETGVSPAPRQRPVDHAGLTAPQAAAESRRCLHCDCRKADGCRLREHCDALGVSATRFKAERRVFEHDLTHPSIIYESGKCIDCGLCIQIAALAKEPLGLTFIGRGFSVRVRAPFDGTLMAALAKVADQCAAACPTGALAKR
ncbi:MAG: FAD-dependent oxidoreductase [Phycisphaerae bacterium]